MGTAAGIGAEMAALAAVTGSPSWLFTVMTHLAGDYESPEEKNYAGKEQAVPVPGANFSNTNLPGVGIL